MKIKIKAGCGITEILRAGCGIKILWRERDFLILTGGMRDEEQKIAAILNRRNQDKLTFRLGWDDGIEPQRVTGSGIKVIPQYCIAHPYCARFRGISTRKLARASTDNERNFSQA